LHYSAELWGPVDPNRFYPDRHKDKRHRLAYGAFGCGPKSCVGQRLALLIIKLSLIRLLRLFNILPGIDIDRHLNIRELSTIAPSEIRIHLQRRSYSKQQ
jgi:cytochrome P450